MKKLLESCFLNPKSSLGFTLIELVAVLGIFTTIGLFITSIIITTLRNTNKTNAVAAVQANGNYAITSMAKLIRSARSLDTSDTCGTTASPTTSNSFAIIGADGNATTFSCTTDAQSRPVIASNGAALTDSTSTKWTSCQFTCGRNSVSDYPVIGINFTLQYVANGNSSNFADQIASSSGIPFQTSVIMRNLER